MEATSWPSRNDRHHDRFHHFLFFYFSRKQNFFVKWMRLFEVSTYEKLVAVAIQGHHDERYAHLRLDSKFRIFGAKFTISGGA